MIFIDPDTGLCISCSPLEYEQIRGRFTKTKITTTTEENEK